jgi:GNAT superfamily N-acetyltransferase
MTTMMDKVNKKDPAMVARMMDLMQAGVPAEKIARMLEHEVEEKKVLAEEGPSPEEVFPEEILLIAQALAYRVPTPVDAEAITKLLNEAYVDETGEHAEAFRLPGPLVAQADVADMLISEEHSWMAVEAPDGRGVEEDGILLGVCCYSTDGVSRKNGEVEGALGSMRYFGILRKYRGVLIGQRLLFRVERAMREAGCVRAMACAASTRVTMMDWLERRGYQCAGGMPYPHASLGQEMIPREGPKIKSGEGDKLDAEVEELTLFRFLKKIDADATASTAAQKEKDDMMFVSLVKPEGEGEATVRGAAGVAGSGGASASLPPPPQDDSPVDSSRAQGKSSRQSRPPARHPLEQLVARNED